jgi:hypothetical protein
MPYSFEKEGVRSEWYKEPADPRDADGNDFGITLFASKRKPEGIRVAVFNGSRVIGEKGSIVRSSETKVLDRESFKVINARTGKMLTEVTYSEKPVGKK